MNGFADHGVDEGSFGEKNGLGQGLRTFDAFPKTKTTYTVRNARGGQWTVVLMITCLILSLSEVFRWHGGHETHQFSVEKGVGHIMQLNMDIVVGMHCADLHVNVQDAAGDRILAGEMLKKDDTRWSAWKNTRGLHSLGRGTDDTDEDEGDHVREVVKNIGWTKKKFPRTPRLRGNGDSCRIYGSMELNKVQGDFHITARGHGYLEFGQHLDHSEFNFSHLVNELSFGPYYPRLRNPLDNTVATTPVHFYKFQYYLSIVPTMYYASSAAPLLSLFTPASYAKTISTNQYAVTEQSVAVGERNIPGIFFKFDIEPILLLVREERAGALRLLVRIVNIVSGVLVGGGWAYQLLDWAGGVWGRRRRAKSLGEGVLHGKISEKDGEDE
ncbi:MAG: hypothetical protein M1825_002674 [Sarcosagium campestre]|nr:MAG: hypothetical protein M1825_002674 [Sarcosagium campestre]